MIAMAVAANPEVLVADEPTTALDVTVQAGILDVLRDLRDRLGAAVILITHDLAVVADVADRVVVMYAGRVVERADIDELFARPRHHYTVGLLGAVPDRAHRRRRRPPAARDPRAGARRRGAGGPVHVRRAVPGGRRHLHVAPPAAGRGTGHGGRPRGGLLAPGRRRRAPRRCDG